MTEQEAAQQYVDKKIMRTLTIALDQLAAACMDESDAPKAPDKKALMKARSMLPAWCVSSLTKPKGAGQ